MTKTKLGLLTSVMTFVGLLAAGVLTASPASALTIEGPYSFNNNASHLCMDVSNGVRDDGGRIQQWWCYGGTPEKWTMVLVKTVAGTRYYRLVNQNSNKCLDVPNGAPVAGLALQQWGCWDGDMQLWARDTTYSTDFPRFRNLMTGMCLDNPNASPDPGMYLQQWPCNSFPAQQWYLS